jgi:hypothetical protein
MVTGIKQSFVAWLKNAKQTLKKMKKLILLSN